MGAPLRHHDRGADWHVLVLAKEPVPGRVKTRMCPPLSAAEAAEVATAALADTLDAVAACSADRRIVALDGHPGPWLPTGFTVVPQRGATFNGRLAAAWRDAGGPGFQIGMDTPQLTAADLDDALARTAEPGTTATLGPAEDGGWWGLGLAHGWDVDVFDGVAMSRPSTGDDQIRSLHRHGHTVTLLPTRRDVDDAASAAAVAAVAPTTRFARTWRGLAAVGS
jgi:glycosyltransferase A (GT-A) superfamily protein (DUF2064 family)